MSESPKYSVQPFPASRQFVIDSVRVGHRKGAVHGLIELDITRVNQILRAYKEKSGETISLTAYLLTCLAQAINEHPMVHALRDWRGRLMIFEEVDITTIIEIEFEGRMFPLAHVIRAANQRDLLDIHREIRLIKSNPSKSASTGHGKSLMRLFAALPFFVRDIYYRYLSARPQQQKKLMGTVMVSAVGMFGQGGGWGIGSGNSFFTLVMLVGGISHKPGIIDGQIVPRDYLSVTLSFDHAIVDGAPAARFAHSFKALVEEAETLAALLGVQA